MSDLTFLEYRWQYVFDAKDDPSLRRHDVAALAADIARMCCQSVSFEEIKAQCDRLSKLVQIIDDQIETSGTE